MQYKIHETITNHQDFSVTKMAHQLNLKSPGKKKGLTLPLFKNGNLKILSPLTPARTAYTFFNSIAPFCWQDARECSTLDLLP